jgi:hypothetical protein
MIANLGPRRRIAYTLVLICSSVVPACSSPTGPQWPWLRGSTPPPDTTNVVMRPSYLPEAKPLFVGGYAGASYGPLSPRRAVAPADVSVPQQAQPTVSISHGSWDEE